MLSNTVAFSGKRERNEQRDVERKRKRVNN
jgi:hypothetical protein